MNKVHIVNKVHIANIVPAAQNLQVLERHGDYMTRKNIAVVYQSRNGNTKAVAEQIANFFHVKAISVEDTLDEPVERLFIGGGAYMHTMDDSLKKFIENLSPEMVQKVTPFSTAGGESIVIRKITEAFQKKGIEVTDESLLIRFYLKGHSMLLQKGGKLTPKQLQTITEFCKKCIA